MKCPERPPCRLYFFDRLRNFLTLMQRQHSSRHRAWTITHNTRHDRALSYGNAAISRFGRTNTQWYQNELDLSVNGLQDQVKSVILAQRETQYQSPEMHYCTDNFIISARQCNFEGGGARVSTAANHEDLGKVVSKILSKHLFSASVGTERHCPSAKDSNVT